jgi:hypothetical protein
VYNLFILTLFSKPMLQRLQSESVQIRMFCVDIETIKCIHIQQNSPNKATPTFL